MASPTPNRFIRGALAMRSDVGALAIALIAAVVIAQFDMGSSASAAAGMDADAASAAARAQGLDGQVVSTRLRTDHTTGQLVWRINSENETAVLDARSGELLSLDWAPES
jgi:hypothetical protein